MTMLKLLTAAGLSAMVLLAPQNSGAAEKPLIGGYDPVAYFTEDKPKKGRKRWSAEWEDGVYYFASAANKERFLASPRTYAAQYGGWCAYAMAKGYIAEVDPVSGWTIRDNKLYLNWSASVKGWWLVRAKSYIARANKNWPRLQEALDSPDPPDISRK